MDALKMLQVQHVGCHSAAPGLHFLAASAASGLGHLSAAASPTASEETAQGGDSTLLRKIYLSSTPADSNSHWS